MNIWNTASHATLRIHQSINQSSKQPWEYNHRRQKMFH